VNKKKESTELLLLYWIFLMTKVLWLFLRTLLRSELVSWWEVTTPPLKNIQFFQTAPGVWKFIEDMTTEEKKLVSHQFTKHIKPRHTSPSTTLPPSLLDHILSLNEWVYELQDSTDWLDYILVQDTDSLDGLAHNQAILRNTLTTIQSSLTALHHKVNDLLQLSSVTHHCALKGVPLSAIEQIKCANTATHLINAASKLSSPHHWFSFLYPPAFYVLLVCSDIQFLVSCFLMKEGEKRMLSSYGLLC